MVDAVLERDTRDPLHGWTPSELEARLREVLRARVEAAFFFGSYGTPDFGPRSDIDLLLVRRTTRPFVERAVEFADLLDLVPSMDILVYTPEELEGLTHDPSPGFWRSVAPTLRPLF